ncbi:MAG: glutamate synthase large subunit [Sphaerochaetaceae bacterium]|nr:glutamate synthase large subunit [Sphaerochaetaceae bacterium]
MQEKQASNEVNNYLNQYEQLVQNGRYGLYRQEFEHDSCGVGFVAHLDGRPRYETIANGLHVLQRMQHRGAIGGDKETGDGSGVMVQIPIEFFCNRVSHIPLSDVASYAIGMFFLPKSDNLREQCISIVEKTCNEQGFSVLGWRKVPVDEEVLGAFARSTEPAIMQAFITWNENEDQHLQQKLYVLRRTIEKTVAAADYALDQFYICSLSNTVIVYKGMLTQDQVSRYFIDLNDELFKSSFCIVHSRFSTNTLPQWKLAQPFRFMAHNGEINTLKANIHRQKNREGFMTSRVLGKDLEKVIPVIDESGSDSSMFDNVLELFVTAGRSIPHVMTMMIPEAYSPEIQMSADKRAFYEYHSPIMEPWDGPAAVVFTDGRYLGATLDRNGLRPARYTITRDGLIVLASETGVLDVPESNIISKGRLYPGKMFLVDLQQHCIIPDNVIKAKLSRQYPYRRWIKDSRIELRGLFNPSQVPAIDHQELLEKHILFGYTDEDLKVILTPMASQGQEAIGSMGNDTGLAVLSDKSHLLFSYFKQIFAQVTNPPIDPLREQLMMSLESFIENASNPLDIDERQYRSLKLYHPILSSRDMVRIRTNPHEDLHPADIDITFDPEDGKDALERAMRRICIEVETLASQGHSMMILTDTHAKRGRAPIPSLLAVSGVHQYMMERNMRSNIGIIAETGEVREVFHFALLVAYGCDAICPYIAFSTIRQLSEEGKLGTLSAETAADNYVNAIKKGLLKTFSRMGISTLHSYFDIRSFEALGLGNPLIEQYFKGTVSRIGGIGFKELTWEIMQRYNQAYPAHRKMPKLRQAGGFYRYRRDGVPHYWSFQAISLLQQATKTEDYAIFKNFTSHMDGSYRTIGEIRGFLDFKETVAIPIEEVEPIETIMRRFASAAMSIGSISKEAHETVAIAMNRIGAKSNSGEGGEDPKRSSPLDNGDSMRSRIKQIASGRFGVTTEYVMSADELQIKMAQGAKPGEGGQLPGNKVTDYIASIRHTVPGVTLISPPPHHDIYSIEDLAQLIYDLKQVNSEAQISVKLVSEPGVGTIASGVVKAKADKILISGQNGGTGAAPLTAIRHVGLPWELGLAETQQSLFINNLRQQVIVQVDGHLKTGRDLAIATLLGAEEYCFGTSLLITLGCMMVRKCHLNMCPFGVATQHPDLRSHFHGKADYIVTFLRFLATEFREYMARLGFRTVEEMVGRSDMLKSTVPTDSIKGRTITLDALIDFPRRHDRKLMHAQKINPTLPTSEFDKRLQAFLTEEFWKFPYPVSLEFPIANTDRTVGGSLSGRIIKQFGSKGLADNTIQVTLHGSAGQSFGAFLAPGLFLRLIGEANDYLGKAMSGGRIAVVQAPETRFRSDRNIICGNVVLYGATAGEVFINGMAGERFAVRNSGAMAVVEGVGDNGCEYMTGGIVAVLGQTGKNFAAGMSGGIAYVYDPSELFDTRCNLDTVELEGVWDIDDQTRLKQLIELHAKYTKSKIAMAILEDWEAKYPQFVKVVPIEYKKVLERMKQNEYRDEETLSVTEEVYHG